MKLTIERNSLVDAVSNVLRAVPTKTSLSILEGILFTAKGSSVSLVGYDLDLGIKTVIPAEVIEDGEIIIGAKIFFDMIKKINSEMISINCDEKGLIEIKGGVTEYTILGIPSDDYPELPELNEDGVLTLTQKALKSQIDQTLFAIATTDSKPVHTGSLFDVNDGYLTLVSVDGYRLAMRKEKLISGDYSDFIVPGKTLSEISKLLDGEDEDKTLNIRVSRRNVLFEIGSYTVISRLLEGEFLDYKAAIPKESSTNVTIKTRDFINSVERTALIISDKMRSPLRMNFENDMLKISCNTNIGKSYDEIPCKIDGNELEIGFNNRYVLDALKVVDCENVVLKISGAISPMKIVPEGEEKFVFLVLPVRLKAD